MVSQKCPRCASSRIRRGYRPTPLWLKVFFRYYLLCDSCNWEFTGFAVPGTVSAKPTRKSKKSPAIEKNTFATNDESEALSEDNDEQAELFQESSSEKISEKKRREIA